MAVDNVRRLLGCVFKSAKSPKIRPRHQSKQTCRPGNPPGFPIFPGEQQRKYAIVRWKIKPWRRSLGLCYFAVNVGGSKVGNSIFCLTISWSALGSHASTWWSPKQSLFSTSLYFLRWSPVRCTYSGGGEELGELSNGFRIELQVA